MVGKFGEGVGIGDWGYLGFVEQIFFSKIFYIGSKHMAQSLSSPKSYFQIRIIRLGVRSDHEHFSFVQQDCQCSKFYLSKLSNV